MAMAAPFPRFFAWRLSASWARQGAHHRRLLFTLLILSCAGDMSAVDHGGLSEGTRLLPTPHLTKPAAAGRLSIAHVCLLIYAYQCWRPCLLVVANVEMRFPSAWRRHGGCFGALVPLPPESPGGGRFPNVHAPVMRWLTACSLSIRTQLQRSAVRERTLAAEILCIGTGAVAQANSSRQRPWWPRNWRPQGSPTPQTVWATTRSG